jgi:outer membrane receptor protein involved in Fe transport
LFVRCIGLSIVLLVPGWAWAQDTDTESETPSNSPVPPPPPSIEEILVLGVESDTAADFSDADSVVGFSADDLAAIGAESIEDIALFTPNLEIVTAGATTPTFFIRGVGLNDFNANSTGSVAIYQDDIAINAPGLQLATIFDADAVNVERGPLGTGQGRNSSAGAIRLYSRKPTGEYGGYLRADYGNYNFMDYEGAVEAPIVEDMLSSRFAFRLSQRDGFMKNNCGQKPGPRPVNMLVGQGAQTVPPYSICGEPVSFQQQSLIGQDLKKWTNDTDNWAARGTLKFEPTLNQTWLINGHGSRRDELTRLGQSIGTGGFTCLDPTLPCAGQGANLRNRTNGVLGGPVDGETYSNNYVPQEIRNRLAELAPCFAFQPDGQSNPNLTPPGGCNHPLNRDGANRAKLKVADELSKDLDSKPWEGDFNRTGPTKNDTYGSFIRGEIGLPLDVQLTTNSGYDTYDRLIDFDLDQSPEELFEIHTEDDSWQFYQDVNFSREMFSDQFPVLLDAGGWFLHDDLNVTTDLFLGDAAVSGVIFRDYTQQVWSGGAYGSFSFDFWTDFTLDGGVRYNIDRKTFDFQAAGQNGDPVFFNFTDTWDAPTGTLRLTYRFRDDTHAYWKYTRGWKPGGYNATASRDTGPTIADPEKIDAFELGLRGAWFDARLTLDASLFYYSYQDYQIFTAQQFLGGTPEFVILNANDAEVYGSEIDASARPWEGGFLAVRFSWLESQFLDFVRRDQFLSPIPSDPVSFRDQQNSGHPLLNSPKYKISLTAEQTVPLFSVGFLTLRYDGAWSDTTYYDPSKGRGLGDFQGNKFLPKNTVAQPPYWIHNLRLGWRSPDERVEIAGWVRNLTNQSYKTFAFDGSTFRNTSIYYVNEPRTYGGSLQVTF